MVFTQSCEHFFYQEPLFCFSFSFSFHFHVKYFSIILFWESFLLWCYNINVYLKQMLCQLCFFWTNLLSALEDKNILGVDRFSIIYLVFSVFTFYSHTWWKYIYLNFYENINIFKLVVQFNIWCVTLKGFKGDFYP